MKPYYAPLPCAVLLYFCRIKSSNNICMSLKDLLVFCSSISITASVDIEHQSVVSSRYLIKSQIAQLI